MRRSIGNMLVSLGRWLGKGAPAGLTGPQWTGSSFIDSFKRERAPTPNELIAELKNTAFTCASINASVCASFPPRLFVGTTRTAIQPITNRYPTRKVKRHEEEYVRSIP